MEIKLDGEAAQEIVQKAIFDSLTDEARNNLVQQAIAALTLRPKKEYGYGSQPTRSPLEEAFDAAVQQASYAAVRAYLDDEKIKQAIQDQIFSALDKIVQDKGAWLYDTIGRSVGQEIAAVLGGKDD